ncbi:MAG: hypothetical protein A2Z24_01660 [Candidatus Woykebacteria bacterium RBG_16_44_10]|uniref:Uncharacterized protein n=1 Tax=Candidatus Woykebacteria bacterium RBG_16_44_10 TaxID=1802597 RepID=A0A1G1WFK5_9BACT|nr:MAG: hypothetical protein A2Z24_01660 [Candidatus Woykebacteria bacterium RBG_16_44_10]
MNTAKPRLISWSTPAGITEEILKICRSLSEVGPPAFVVVKPHPLAITYNCYDNVERVVEKEGGEAVVGWAIYEDPLAFQFIHHLIWVDPSGNLVDVTPNEICREQVLFIPLEKQPAEVVTPVPSNFFARVEDPAVEELLKIFEDEIRLYRRYHNKSTGEPCIPSPALRNLRVRFSKIAPRIKRLRQEAIA